MTDPTADFVRANTALRAVPLTPEIELYVADESLPLWEKTEDELGAIGLPPPFWAFAWAGGQALARHVLDHPTLVAGRAVLDFGAGSGLVGLAAAKAGAASVVATDIDAFAVAAMQANAAANRLALSPRLDDVVGRDDGWDVVLAADVAYEAGPADRIFTWLHGLAARGATVLIGDPGRSYLPQARLVAVAEYQAPTTRELEDQEIKRTTVWRFA